MSNWVTLKPNQLIPSGIVGGISAVGDVITSELGKIQDLSIPSLPSLNIDPVEAITNAILDTITGVLKAGRIHTLIVPISKSLPKRPSILPATLGDLQSSLDTRLGPASTGAADTYADIITREGGNAGFYRSFAESLFDPNDPNRPQYEASDAVVMATMLVGAPRYNSIVSAASTLNMLFKPKSGASFLARTIPIPQNLTAKTVGTAVKPGIGIHLEWDPPTAANSPYFPGVTMVVKRYAVIRTTNAKLAVSASSIFDLFSTQTLTDGLTSGDSTVVNIGSGANSSYLDTSVKPFLSIPHYYFIVWECEAREAGVINILPFDGLSNMAKVVVQAPPPAQTGNAPDWTATDSAVLAFPALANATTRLIEEAKILLRPRVGPSDRLKAAVGLVNSASKRISSRSQELIDDVKKLATALSRPMPSLYITQMSNTKGGNAFLLAELAKRLNDTSDSSRPQFDHGEYVCGVCFVAGAPRLADLADIISFFAALFGAADSTNPLLGVLASIDTLVTATETTVFPPTMVPFPPGTDVTNINPLTGLPNVANTPVIANDGTPVISSSSENPNEGDTNVTPIESLC